MSVQIENRFTSNFDMIQEFYRKVTVGPRPWTYWLSPIYVVGWFVCRENSVIQTLCITMLLMQIFLPDLVAFASLRSVKKENNGVLPETRVEFGEDIQCFEGMVHLTVPYEKIKKVVRLKYSIAILTGKRTGFLMDPNGFTQGSWEQLRDLLREKRPDLKICD